MDFTFEGRRVRLLFTKTLLNPRYHPRSNSFHSSNNEFDEIPDSQMGQLGMDRDFWNRFIPQHFRERQLGFSPQWYLEQRRGQIRMYGAEMPIVDIRTRVDMTQFPVAFNGIRVYSIQTFISDRGPIEMQVHCHKDRQ